MLDVYGEMARDAALVSEEIKEQYRAIVKKYYTLKRHIRDAATLNEIREETEYQQLVEMGRDILPLVRYDVACAGYDYRSAGLVLQCLRTEIAKGTEKVGRVYNDEYFAQLHREGAYSDTVATPEVNVVSGKTLASSSLQQQSVTSNNNPSESHTSTIEQHEEEDDDTNASSDDEVMSNNFSNGNLNFTNNQYLTLSSIRKLSITTENAAKSDSIISLEHLFSWIYKMPIWVQVHLMQNSAIAMLVEELKSQQNLFYFNKSENLYIEPSAINNATDEPEYYGCGEERAVASCEIQHNLWGADSLC